MERILHVLILRYSGPLAEALPHSSEHVAYLERHHANGIFLFSGQTTPVDDGGVILARGDRGHIEQITAEDPFIINGVATYEIISVPQGRIHPKLAEILDESMGSEDDSGGHLRQWTPEEYRGLWTDSPEVISALNERSLEPVLQQAGTAVLKGLGFTHSPGPADLARRCAAGLRERDWPGDELLADELERALRSKTGESELLPTPIDLESLVEALGSDPTEGAGAFDPLTGDVLSAVVMSSGGFEDEDIDEDPEVQRIEISPDSQGAYLDMVLFADTVTDLRLRERLQWALDGRGAFRRFKDAIHNADEDTLSVWTIFSEERALGRARLWLAEHGYRPQT